MTASIATAKPLAAAAAGAVQVMIVDDSAVIRGVLTRWLEQDPAIRVVASAQNGAIAVRQIAKQPVDVVILDIEMPEMDGMTALPLLLESAPGVQIIMASTLTLRNADISMRALSLGAVDYVPKPQSGKIISGIDFRQELIEKVKAFGAVAARKRSGRPGAAPVFAAERAKPGLVAAPQSKATLARLSERKPAVLAIGSSTGGPQALFKFLGALPKPLGVPVLITQHMPATFTTILAQHIQKSAGIPASEAVDGEPVRANHVYVAPGDWHMSLTGRSDSPRIRLEQSPPVNYCRPAVDPLFESVARIFGAATLAVVLTGMGHDGRDGARVIVGAGGSVLAQDEASSVVWGMPGAVAGAGLAADILPLEQLAPRVARILSGAVS